MEPTNEQRAEWAHASLAAHARATGQRIADEAKECLTDLLANLRHLAPRLGLDFADCLRIADDHHGEELREENSGLPQAEAAGLPHEVDISRALVLSTTHLPDVHVGPSGECNLYDVEAIVEEQTYGWRLYIGCDEPDPSEYGRLGQAVMIGRALGCRWLEYDRDGDTLTNLPTWTDAGEMVKGEPQSGSRDPEPKPPTLLDVVRLCADALEGDIYTDAEEYGLAVENAHAVAGIARDALRGVTRPPSGVVSVEGLAGLVDGPADPEYLRALRDVAGSLLGCRENMDEAAIGAAIHPGAAVQA